MTEDRPDRIMIGDGLPEQPVFPKLLHISEVTVAQAHEGNGCGGDVDVGVLDVGCLSLVGVPARQELFPSNSLTMRRSAASELISLEIMVTLSIEMRIFWMMRYVVFFKVIII